MALHRDDPGWQLLWHPEHYDSLWTAPGYEPGSEVRDVPITGFFFSAMRRVCFEEADQLIETRGLLVDTWGRFTLAKASAAALQRASLVLRDEARGVFADHVQPPAAPLERVVSPLRTPSAQPFTFDMLVDQWKLERQPRSKTAYESTNMVRKLEAHLGFSDVRRLTTEDLIGWKDALRASRAKVYTRAVSAASTENASVL